MRGQAATGSATEAFTRLRKKAKVSTRLHDTRHTAASVLIASGVNVRTVPGILGHSSPGTKLGMYTHMIQGAERKAVDALGEHLNPAIGGAKKN